MNDNIYIIIYCLLFRDKEQVLHEQKLAELDEAKTDGENAWSSKAATDEDAPAEEVKKEEEPEQKKEEPAKPQKYVPPNLRSSLNTQQIPKRVPKNKTPEIKNQSEFPTLG